MIFSTLIKRKLKLLLKFSVESYSSWTPYRIWNNWLTSIFLFQLQAAGEAELHYTWVNIINLNLMMCSKYQHYPVVSTISWQFNNKDLQQNKIWNNSRLELFITCKTLECKSRKNIISHTIFYKNSSLIVNWIT